MTAVRRLFGLLPPQDVADAEVFLSAATSLFAEYAPTIMMAAVFEIARRSDQPRLKLMAEVLDRLTEKARAQEPVKPLPPLPPREPRTPEEQARIDALVGDARRAFGLPIEGRQRQSIVPNEQNSAQL